MESQKFGCSASKKNRSRLPACDVQNVEKRKTRFPEIMSPPIPMPMLSCNFIFICLKASPIMRKNFEILFF
jgi:hypothetical protein